MIDSNAPAGAAATCRFPLIAGRDGGRQFRHIIVAFAVFFCVVTTKQQIQPLGIRSHWGAMDALFVASIPLASRAVCVPMFGRLVSRWSQANENL